MTFLGMPTAPRGVGQLRQEAPFPVAAAKARSPASRATSACWCRMAAVHDPLGTTIAS